MKAVIFNEFGDSGVLRCTDVPDPAPGPGEVLVELHRAAINHVDLDVRSGVSRFGFTLPHILGIEGAGDVVAAGAGVDEALLGERVAIYYIKHCGSCQYCFAGQQNLCDQRQLFGEHIPGTYAEKIVIPAGNCLRLPQGVSYEAGAASVVVFGTAWHALISTAQLRPGETVLIHSVGGGVASAALQIAKLAGTFVIVTASSDEKLERAREHGANLTINYRNADVFKTVDEWTYGRGVDVVFDTVGGATFKESMFHMAPGGRLLSIGAHAGEHTDLDLIELFRRHVSLMGSHTQTKREADEVLSLIARGMLHPYIWRTYPLDRAPDAHEALASREHYGKILLDTTSHR